MALAVTGLNAHTFSPHISNASSSTTLSLPLHKHPLHRLRTLRRFQKAHLSANKSFQKTHLSANKTRSNSRGVVVCSMGKLGETEAISLEENPRRLAEKLPGESGVYAMHDKNGEVQYIGISRTISKSVLYHIKDVPELCGSVKIAVVDPGRTGSGLTNAWKFWMNEHIEVACKIPLGNDAWNETWEEKEDPIMADLRLKPDCYAEWNTLLEQAIEQLIHENEVMAFIKGSRTAPRCPLSCRALAILDEQNINYETIDVFDEVYNPGLGKALKAYTGFPTIPQVFVHGKFIGGVDDLNEMAEKGELYQLFIKQRQQKMETLMENYHALTDEKMEGIKENYYAPTDEKMEGINENYYALTDEKMEGIKENYYSLTDEDL